MFGSGSGMRKWSDPGCLTLTGDNGLNKKIMREVKLLSRLNPENVVT
jgi:hypothetical protein